MKTVERELYDLEEYLRRNDDSADGSAYLTIVGIANDVSEIEAENESLRELVRDMFEEIEAGGFDPMVERQGKRGTYYEEDPSWRVGIRERMRKLGIEV
jgi:hypothetical protein